MNVGKTFEMISKQNHCQDGMVQFPLCRLCACGNKRMVSIYDEEGIRMALAYKINKHLPITVSPENKLPLEVCDECVSDLNASMDFVKKCMENQIKLRKMLNLSVEDCDNKTEESHETKYQRSTSKGKKSTANIKDDSICRSNHDKNYYLEGSCEKPVENKNQMGTKCAAFNVCEEDDACTYSELVVNKYDKDSVLPSNEVEPSLAIETIKSERIENYNQKVELLHKNDEGIKINETVISSTVEGNSELKHFCKYCGEGFLWKAELFTHQTQVHPDLVFRCSFCLKIFYDKEEFYSHELAHRKQLPPGFKGKISLRRHLKGSYARSAAKVLDEMSIPDFVEEEKETQLRKDSHKSSYSNPSESILDVNCNDENDKKCCYCDISFDTVKEKRKHMKLNHNIRLPCHFCPRIFNCEFELKKHEANHQKGKKRNFRCKICNNMFVSYHLLKKHELLHSDHGKFQCEICLELFNNKNELEEHVQSHAGESSYLCEICGQSIDSFVIFRLHKMDHIQNDYYKCKLCNKSFSNTLSLKNHELSHSKKKKLVCKVCGENFSSSDLLKEHKLSHDGEDFKCEVCNKSFTGLKKLKNHIQTHSVERNYLCEKCGKDFKSNSSLHKHRYLCQVTIACTVCGKEFDCNTRLKVHMRVHTGEKPFVCSVCGKGFHASWSLSQHSATHNTVKIPCPLCGALFNRKSNMLTHKKRHRVPCGICNKVFANIPLLLAHQRTHVESINEEVESETAKDDSSVAFPCDQCGKLFVTSLDLKAHMSTHSDERPYKCEICGKSWRLQKTLKKHMVTHSGRKPYQCRYCTCTFLLHQRLIKHENGHTAGKPYSCQDCGQSFWTQLNLEKHSIRHCAMRMTDQKYACNFCDKTFERKSSLMIHKRTHTTQLSYGCTFCPRKFSQLRFAQRHKCALDPNNQIRDSSAEEGLFSTMPTLTEEESCSPDENTCPDVLNEEVVYDMDSVSTSYAEIIVISQSMDDLIVENNNELNKST